MSEKQKELNQQLRDRTLNVRHGWAGGGGTSRQPGNGGHTVHAALQPCTCKLRFQIG